MTTCNEDGCSSLWYGWTTNLFFTYEKALEKKNQLNNKGIYDEIEILKVKD